MKNVKLVWSDEAAPSGIYFDLKSNLGLFDIDMHPVVSEEHWKNMHTKDNEPAILTIDPGTSASELMQAIDDLSSKGGFQTIRVMKARPTLASFKQLKLGMSLADIYQLVGRPTKDVGSGLYILNYILDDGSMVVLSYSHPQNFKISHLTADGKKSEEIPVK